MKSCGILQALDVAGGTRGGGLDPHQRIAVVDETRRGDTVLGHQMATDPSPHRLAGDHHPLDHARQALECRPMTAQEPLDAIGGAPLRLHVRVLECEHPEVLGKALADSLHERVLLACPGTVRQQDTRLGVSGTGKPSGDGGVAVPSHRDPTRRHGTKVAPAADTIRP